MANEDIKTIKTAPAPSQNEEQPIFSGRNDIKYARNRKRVTPGFIIATVIVCIGAFSMVFPYIWMLLTSFKSVSESWAAPPTLFPSTWYFDAYYDILSDENFYMSVVYTLVIEVTVIVVGTFSSSLAAFSFAKLKLKGKKFWLLLLMSSMMVPHAAVMLPQYRAFQALGLTETLWPLILPGLFGNISMMFFLITYMKNGIPDSLIEAAKIDGSNFFQMYWRIGLPLSKPAIAAQCVFWFVGIWNDFFGPSIYLTNPNVVTLQVYLNSLLSSNNGNIDLPTIMAGSVLASVPMIIIFVCFSNFFVNSISLGGMKE